MNEVGLNGCVQLKLKSDNLALFFFSKMISTIHTADFCCRGRHSRAYDDERDASVVITCSPFPIITDCALWSSLTTPQVENALHGPHFLTVAGAT